MPKQLHGDTTTTTAAAAATPMSTSDTVNKLSGFNLPNKKWNVLRTGVIWAQRLKSVKATKSDGNISHLNNNSGNQINKDCGVRARLTNEDYKNTTTTSNNNNNNSNNNNNVNIFAHLAQRAVSNTTKLTEKDYEYTDKKQKRGVIKHCSSAKQLTKSFPSSTSVNTLISKSNSTNLTNDPSKSPILHTSIFPLSSQEYRKDFKGIRFTCEGKDDLKSNNQISNIALIGNSNTSITTTTNNNNTPTDNANQQHLTNAPCKRISFNLKDNINTKVACSNDTSPEKVMTTSIFSGIWPINPYSPLPSPDIYHLEDEFDADSFTLDAKIKTCNEHLQRHESWQSLELDTPPASSGTGETDTTVASTTKAITPGDQTTGPLGSGGSSSQGGQDNEQMDLASRRGRRSAIIDNKNLIGESEVDHQDSPGISQSTNKTLSEVGQERPPIISTVNSFRERQRRMLRKQNTIADLSCRNQVTNSNQDYELKRRANVFMKLIERGTRSKESLLDLNEALQSLKSSYFHDQYLESFRDFHWSQLDKSGATEDHDMPDREVRRREAVWELFKSELTFFIDHLMVLKNCFMEPLKKLQVDGYLMFVEPMHLFGNLDDLCYVSHTFCRELIGNLSQETLTNEFGSTDVLLRPLKRWSEHSRDGEIYHNYCLNYDSALTYLDSLRKFEHFNEFEKWCEQDTRCRRLQLTDLLVAPMQHYMKIPLMLSSIRRYTASSAEQEMLTACLTKVENSLKSLEDKMRWLKNFERLQEIQSQLIWPSVSELEPRVFIPEFLRQSLARQPCERLIANPKRQLLHEGFLTLNDGTKTIEIFAFLFDDFLLITRIKKPPKKKSFSENPLIGRSITEGGVFVVYRQVIALDRFTIHDLGIVEATANGLRNAIVLVLITRFQQITGVYTLQAANELDKQRWIEKLRNSQQAFQEKLKHKLYGIDVDQHTNKHSKLINQKPKLTNQVSLAEDTLSSSLSCDVVKGGNDESSSGKLSNDDDSCTTNQDKKANNRSSGNLMSNASSTRGTSKSLVNDSQLSTVQQQQNQEGELQECDSLIKITSPTDNPLIETIHESSSEPERSEVIVEISEKDTAKEYLKVDNPSSGNKDCSSDELGATVSTPISLSEVLLPNSKTPEYLMRNRHSLDPNLTKLTIPEINDNINPPTETSSSSSPSTTTTTTVTTTKTDKLLAQTNTEIEKQIVAPIFSPPSLLLFDRVSHPTNFAYAATRQTQFSPPLSPILHAPCASLPLDITTQNLYDLPDRLLTRLNITGNPISSDSESHEERLSQKTPQNPPFR